MVRAKKILQQALYRANDHTRQPLSCRFCCGQGDEAQRGYDWMCGTDAAAEYIVH
jgi:hypothetical protein